MCEDRKVNLRMVVEKIILSWRRIIVLMAVLAFVFAGLKYIKERKNATNNKVYYELTIDEIEQVEGISNLYEQLDEYNAYMNTPIMNLNPYNVGKIYLNFYIDVDSNEDSNLLFTEEKSDSIVLSYVSYIFSEDFLKEFSEDIWGTDTEQYMGDYIDVEYGDSYFVVSVIENELDMSVDEFADKFMTLLESINLSSSLHSQYELVMLGAYKKYAIDKQLIELRNDYITVINDIESQISNTISSFSDLQNEYLSYLNNGVEYDEFIEAKNNSSNNAIKTGISKKYIVLGALLGILFSCFLTLCNVILSDKLLSKDDIEEQYGIRLLGYIREKNHKRKFFQAIDEHICNIFETDRKTYNEEAQFERIATEIKLITLQRNVNNIAIVSSCREVAIREFAEKIRNSLPDSNNVSIAWDYLNNAESLSKSYEAGNVIILEKNNESVCSDINKEIKIAKEYNTNILGAIVITD